MKRLLVLLSALLLGATFAQDPIRVGVNMELSGAYASLGQPGLEGAQVAQQQMGEVLGRPVELSVCDNATTAETSIACANRFVDEGVVAVIGAGSSGMSIPAAEILQAAGIPMVSVSSTNPATTQIGDYIFRIAYTDDFQGRVAARYAYDDLGARRAAVFRAQDDDYSFGLGGFFDEEFQALGGETVVVDYTTNTVDYSAQINDLRGFEPDVIYFAGFPVSGVNLIPQLRQQGFDQQILGADASDTPELPEGAGESVDGMLFTGFGGAEVLTGEAATRASDFQTLFGTEMPNGTFNGFTLAGADAYNVVVEAIRLADSTDHAAVRDALAELTDYPGVSGNITFAGTDGTPADRTIAFFEYQVPGADGAPWSKMTSFGLSTGSDEGN